MIDQLNKDLEYVRAFQADTEQALEDFRIKYLGKKGKLTEYFAALKDVPGLEKKAFGLAVN